MHKYNAIILLVLDKNERRYKIVCAFKTNLWIQIKFQYTFLFVLFLIIFNIFQWKVNRYILVLYNKFTIINY